MVFGLQWYWIIPNRYYKTQDIDKTLKTGRAGNFWVEFTSNFKTETEIEDRK